MTTKTSNTTQRALPGLDETSERPAASQRGRNGGKESSGRKRSTHIERAIRRRLTMKFYQNDKKGRSNG